MKAALLGALCVLCVTAQHPAVSDTIFAAGEGPKCWLHNGKTIVHYTSTMHDSFHC